MPKIGIDSLAKTVSIAQDMMAMKSVADRYYAAPEENKQEEFDEMMRTASRFLGPEAQVFVYVMEYAPVIAADALYNVYKSEKTKEVIDVAKGAAKCLYDRIKNKNSQPSVTESTLPEVA